MARLVVHPGSPAAWETQLKPGANVIGRSPDAGLRIPHASVSSFHCEITVTGDSAAIRDLNSTNGTFVNRQPVQEAALQPGQTIHLGEVEMLYVWGEAAPALPKPPLRARVVLASEKAKPLVANLVAPAAQIEAIPLPPPPSPDTVAQPPIAVTEGSRYCKHHRATPGRYFCNQCQQLYCEACVINQSAGGKHKHVCRHCGAECETVRVNLSRGAPQKGILARLPDAFGYPLRGGGVFMVVAGVVLAAALKGGLVLMSIGSIRLFIMGVILEIAAGGYLCTYLQELVQSTVAEEKEMPDLPGIGNFLEDVLLPFFRLLGLGILSFGPTLIVAVLVARSPGHTGEAAMLAVLAAGYIYFPMAFLAVAVLDSILAANPLLVIPSIVKAPLQYLVALAVLAAGSATHTLVPFLTQKLFPEGWSTHSMGELFAMVGVTAATGFFTVYLWIVGIRVLALVYLTKKDDLCWLNR
jgi:hypothetical protein